MLYHDMPTPFELGYYFPAEFAPQAATWLSCPHKEASWPGKIDKIYPSYCAFIKELLKGQRVCINVVDEAMQKQAEQWLLLSHIDPKSVEFYRHPTNDAWCRDHGPAFLINPMAEIPKVIVDWGYNAWGDKYPPYDLDDNIPTLIADMYNIPVYHPGIVMEGGAVDFNGQGTVLTSTACLLNPNRNPHLNQKEIEAYLHHFYGVEQILWVDEGIVGDDTDGHIDDTARFVSHDTILAVIEHDKADDNYSLLMQNMAQSKNKTLLDGK